MTRVIKHIRGRDYYYYQTSLGTGKRPVTTYICPTQRTVIRLSNVSPLINHLIELFDRNALLDHVDYRFQNPPSNPDNNNRMLEYTRALIKFIRQNLVEEYQNLEQIVFVKYVHGSNAIEGNSLTQSEVRNYLYNDQSPLGKSHNELLQTRNHFNVKSYLDNYKGEINEKLIKKIHETMMAGVDGYDHKDKPGRYRENMVKVKAGNVTIPKPEDIQINILKTIEGYHEMLNGNIHPIDCMAVFHAKFERIHPFRDGNGRTGRAILDYMLTNNDFPSIYIPPREREKYLNVLRECNFAEYYTPLVDFLCNRIKATLNFIAARSTMYHSTLSEQYRSFFVKNIGTEDYYNQMITYLTKVRESDEDP